MFAKLWAAALVTLCVLPFTQPFATDSPDLRAQSSRQQLSMPDANPSQPVETDAAFRSVSSSRAGAVLNSRLVTDDVIRFVTASHRRVNPTVAASFDPPVSSPLRL